jgi:hypothetical protein
MAVRKMFRAVERTVLATEIKKALNTVPVMKTAL